MSVDLRVYANPAALAEAIATQLITRVAEAQSARGTAHIVLTGGGVGIATLAAVAASPSRDAVDWRNLHVWWGDERFVPASSADRNELQAGEALLGHVPIPVAHIHPMPAADGPHRDADSAAAHYAEELAAHAKADVDLPQLDVLLLGVGPDGHVASLFPEAPALYDERAVTAVHGSPKPPPVRITLTFPTIRAADEVWLLAAGEAKAAVVGLAVSGAGPTQIPAAGAHGRLRTRWLLDNAAAARVPPQVKNPF